MFIGGRAIDFIVIFLCLVFLVRKKVIAVDKQIVPLIVLGVLSAYVGVSLLFEGAIGGIEVNIRDLFEPFRYFIVLIILIASFNCDSVCDEKKWNRFWLGAIVLFGVIVAVKIFRIPGLYELSNVFYGASKDKFVADRFLFRQTGFFVNPNWAGVFLSWALSYVLFVIESKLFKKLLLVLFVCLLILTTGSRTSLICSLSVLLFWGVISLRIGKSIVLFSFIVGTFVIFKDDIIQYLPFHYRQLVRAVFQDGSLASVNTFGDRLDIWKDCMDRFFYDAPIFGNGAFKFGVVSVTDNQYVKWLIWYGMAGLILNVCFFFYLTIPAIQVAICNSGFNRRFAKFFLGMMFSLTIAGITGAFVDVTQLAIIVFVSGGVILRAAADKRNGDDGGLLMHNCSSNNV